MKPIRVQRKRIKGWKMPENTVYVGRPTEYGNPFHVKGIDHKTAVERFALHIEGYFGFVGTTTLKEWLKPLIGKNLACFCPLDKPCHADVLLDLCNEYSEKAEK
jgi:hypothetical protein